MIGQLDKAVQAHLLYDCYSSMLTERQRETFELHYFEDFSLAEIADRLSISRQAVHDIVHRTVSQLTDFEDKLHLLDSLLKRHDTLQKLQARLTYLGIYDDPINQLMNELL